MNTQEQPVLSPGDLLGRLAALSLDELRALVEGLDHTAQLARAILRERARLARRDERDRRALAAAGLGPR
jgi:hypothetical protein